jgi:ABC-2 type transport system permease protein
MIAVLKREIKSYFITPLGYVFIGVYLIFSGAFFYFFTLTAHNPTMGAADFSAMFALMFFVLMITVPLLTMRLISEDRKAKTDQLTLTAPISLFGLVFAKFAAAYSIFLLSTAIMPVYAIVLGQFTDVNWFAVIGNTVALMLLGGIFTAAGLFVSSLTENQMIAAILSVFVNIGFILASLVAPLIEVRQLADAVRALSLLERYDRFTMGVFEVSNALFFVSVTVVFLFLTVRVLERRRWA